MYCILLHRLILLATEHHVHKWKKEIEIILNDTARYQWRLSVATVIINMVDV